LIFAASRRFRHHTLLFAADDLRHADYAADDYAMLHYFRHAMPCRYAMSTCWRYAHADAISIIAADACRRHATLEFIMPLIAKVSLRYSYFASAYDYCRQAMITAAAAAADAVDIAATPLRY